MEAFSVILDAAEIHSAWLFRQKCHESDRWTAPTFTENAQMAHSAERLFDRSA
jgi:hypothetical protein